MRFEAQDFFLKCAFPQRQRILKKGGSEHSKSAKGDKCSHLCASYLGGDLGVVSACLVVLERAVLGPHSRARVAPNLVAKQILRGGARGTRKLI